MSTVFPIFYLGPISYFASLHQASNIVLEKHEHFPKQTYRNRCYILGANGKQRLVIPTEHNGQRSIKDTQISYAYNWPKEHIKSLESAYRRSPYFEFYEDELIPLIETPEKYLLDFNYKLLERILKLLQIEIDFMFTDSYQSSYAKDFREEFNAKTPPENYPAYPQVFEEKLEKFHSDLSIIDLICNMGPQSSTYLKEIIV